MTSLTSFRVLPVLLALSGCHAQQQPSHPDPDAKDKEQDEDKCPCRTKRQAESSVEQNQTQTESQAASSLPPQCVAHSHGSGEAGGSQQHQPGQPHVISHSALKTYENNGNSLIGVATGTLGAQDFEVWRTSVAVGSSTPAHTHTSEEVFVVLQGRGRAHVGDDVLDFEAPATVIAPAGVPHFIENTGTVPTDSIVIVGPGSTITNAKGETMQLPWRR